MGGPAPAARTASDGAPHPALLVRPDEGIRHLKELVDGCRACDLWARATQGVPGEGPRRAPLMLVGEQPGDREDLAGHPFVGPAGAMLDKALEDAGITREQAFVTNAVKHFKWKPSGKRRLHEKPNAREVRACRPWLDLELDAVRPNVLVLLGAMAATAVLGPAFRLTQQRGVLLPDGDGGPARLATYHPSAILRARDGDREELYGSLVGDLRTAAAAIAGRS